MADDKQHRTPSSDGARTGNGDAAGAGAADSPDKPPAVSIAEALSLARRHHKAGRVAEAVSVYKRILRARPDTVEALYPLGVMARRNGENELAADLLGKVVARQADHSGA
ncbi:MAG: tetratricopeptide repeat protein, partial [Proteobacteria bacterium]|nr:tetratricopeptide repeat protein [Pseudomonadota bacterium]